MNSKQVEANHCRVLQNRIGLIQGLLGRGDTCFVRKLVQVLLAQVHEKYNKGTYALPSEMEGLSLWP